MHLIATASFSNQNLTSEHAIIQQTLAGDVGMLAVVLMLRGLSTADGTRELRVFLDGLTIAGSPTDNVPVNQPGGLFAESHGASTTRLSVIVPGVRAGQTIDVRVRSGLAGDTGVSGTLELFSLDLLSAAQAATLLAELHLCKAVLANRQVQTIATGVVQVMDDDDATPIRTLTPQLDDLESPTQNILAVS